jgi:hypothetical protein
VRGKERSTLAERENGTVEKEESKNSMETPHTEKMEQRRNIMRKEVNEMRKMEKIRKLK